MTTDTAKRRDAILQKLKEHQHKLTPQRLAIVDILAGSEGHPNVETIYEELRDDFPTMSLATVYRNVMLVKSLGEVLELGFPDGSNRYDGRKPYPHPHVICVKCKKIIDSNLSQMEDIAATVASETGFQILTHRLDFFGLCADCRFAG
ncbi:MAG: Fur family transcriptional regulator [Desulfobacterales bacterium]